MRRPGRCFALLAAVVVGCSGSEFSSVEATCDGGGTCSPAGGAGGEAPGAATTGTQGSGSDGPGASGAGGAGGDTSGVGVGGGDASVESGAGGANPTGGTGGTSTGGAGGRATGNGGAGGATTGSGGAGGATTEGGAGGASGSGGAGGSRASDAGADTERPCDAGTPTGTCVAGPTAGSLTAGGRHTCGIFGNVTKCWGYPNDGQLGLADTVVRGDDPNEMGANLPPVSLGTGRRAVQVSAGIYHTCAVLDNGQLKCWGENGAGPLGLGHKLSRGNAPGHMGDDLPPVDVGNGRRVVQVSAGWQSTCAVLDDGSVKCWGANWAGGLGRGDKVNRGDLPGQMGDNLAPIDLGTGRKAKSVLTRYGHTCALLDNGAVKCWGANGNGQCGVGDNKDRGDDPDEMGDHLPYVDLGTGRTVVQITGGGWFTCALLDNQTVKCWGDNFSGTLGLGDQGRRGDSPGTMGDALNAVALGTGRHAVRLASSWGDTCALLDNGSVKCWGASSAVLAQGDSETRGDAPGEMGDALPTVNLGTGRTAILIEANGYDHACAVLDDLTIKCWGSNGWGRLGLGDANDRGDQRAEMGDALPVVNVP